MKRNVLFFVILTAISVITVGMVIGSSSGTKEPKTAIIANQATGASTPTVVTVQLTPNSAGNYRHPGVAEDSRGNRLVIFRGTEGTKYYFVYCEKDGMWSAPAAIAGGVQPTLISSLYAYMEVDSSDHFHCYWENANAAVYTSFKNGVWTTPIKVSLAGRYDLISAMAMRSTDEVVTVDCGVTGFDKEIYLHRKGKNDAIFGKPFNLSRDGQVASTQPHVAVDSKDHLFVVWKSDYKIEDVDENLVIYMSQFDTNSSDVDDWIIVSPNPGWSFLPQVAVNSEDKVMTLFSCSTAGQYLSSLYDPVTKKLSKTVSLDIGLCRVPWHTFFSKLVSHGKDFYAAAINPGRILYLMKFDEATSKWNQVARISDRSAEVFALYSGFDNMLVAWNSFEEPTSVFLTTVSVEPFSKIKVRSVSNLIVEKKEERGFFRGYFLNSLAWTANSDNTQKGIVVTAQRIYRKARTENDSKWTRIAEVTGTILKYEDRNIPANSDYVYAVTCVDDKEHESRVY